MKKAGKIFRGGPYLVVVSCILPGKGFHSTFEDSSRVFIVNGTAFFLKTIGRRVLALKLGKTVCLSLLFANSNISLI